MRPMDNLALCVNKHLLLENGQKDDDTQFVTIRARVIIKMILFLISIISHWLRPELEDQDTVEMEPVRPARGEELPSSWVRNCSGRLQRATIPGDNNGWILCSRNPNMAHRKVIGEQHYDH